MSNTQNQIKMLKKEVAPFEKVDTKASVIQILNTILPFFLLWFLAYKSLSVSMFLTIPILIVASGLLVRIFIIFHDCCHSSFFTSSKANDILGTITGILTVVPYRQWKHSHSVHHATSSNLDKRGTGDMWLLTVDEYIAAPLWKKAYYRIYRNPFFMFCIGPIAVFLIQYRFNRKGAKRKERVNTYITNFFIVLISAIMCYSIGWQNFLFIQGFVFFVSGVMGIWLFYVQHQFEDSYFEHEEEWNYVQAAVEGSSFYKLPKVLQWITGSIGYHHVHHLAPRVPNYNLEKAHNETLPLQKATTITLLTSLKSLKFRVWDEKTKTFLSFKEMKRSLKQADTRVSSVKMNLKAKNPKLAE